MMTQTILDRLADVEKQHNIRLLYALESGSRGWGFPSPNSDYDVRFVYAHPIDWYLSISDKKDQMSFPIDDELDLTGWELRKFLRLMSKSNATPFEWLQSPIVYRQEGNFREELWALAAAYFNPRHSVNHYLGIAYNSVQKGTKGGFFDIKKYFYVLRPLLAARWALLKQSVPPMQFEPLLTMVEDEKVLAAIRKLLAQKATAMEGDLVDADPVLDKFIKKEAAFCKENSKSLNKIQTDRKALDAFFRKIIVG